MPVCVYAGPCRFELPFNGGKNLTLSLFSGCFCCSDAPFTDCWHVGNRGIQFLLKQNLVWGVWPKKEKYLKYLFNQRQKLKMHIFKCELNNFSKTFYQLRVTQKISTDTSIKLSLMIYFCWHYKQNWQTCLFRTETASKCLKLDFGSLSDVLLCFLGN